MGKNHSKFGLSLAGKKRENPEGSGGTYVLNGCVNGRFRNSEDCVWSNAATSGSPARFALSSAAALACTQENLKTSCQCKNEQQQQPSPLPPPVGFAEDNCRFEVALPPEVTGSACSVKVYAMEDRDSICKPPLSPSNGKVPPGAVDYNVSLDRESDQQEWSFTLYDFDGHRRVTREDLSSVLKSISEALSTTVTLPPCGSKKLHLRLSILPDADIKSADQDKVQKKALAAIEDKAAKDVVLQDSKQTTKCEQQTITTAAPILAGNHNNGPLTGNNNNGQLTGNTNPSVPLGHVHRRHHHHGHRDRVRSSKRHSRSHAANHGDAVNLESVRSPEKRHSRVRRHHSSRQQASGATAVEPPAEASATGATTLVAATATTAAVTTTAAVATITTLTAVDAALTAVVAEPSAGPTEATATAAATTAAEMIAASATASKPASNDSSTKESSTPDTPCTVIVNKLTAENLANHDNHARRSDENRERRSYYQELAGIDNTCSNQEEPSDVVIVTPAQVLKTKHERTKGRHHRRGEGSPRHRRSKIYDIDIPPPPPPAEPIDRTSRNVNKSKGSTHYHMQLLEASRAKLENQQQPVVVPAIGAPPPPTSPPVAPAPGAENGIGASNGVVVMHRKEQRRRHHHGASKSKRPQTLQPFMLFEHELTESNNRQVYVSPTLHASPMGNASTAAALHDHHHHHEHHHHYHYHHYHT